MKTRILDLLDRHGEQLDIDIAKLLKLTKADVAELIADLSAAGEIICCCTTRYVDGKKIEGTSCRLSARPPKAAPGPKIGATKTVGSNEE